MRRLRIILPVFLSSILVVGLIGLHTARHTILRPAFYVEQLDQAGSYRALREVEAPRLAGQWVTREFGEVGDELRAEIATLVAATLHEDLLMDLSQQSLWEVRDGLGSPNKRVVVSVPTQRLLRAAGQQFVLRLNESVLFEQLYARFVRDVSKQLRPSTGHLPFGLTFDAVRVAEGVRTVAPAGWVGEQLGQQFTSLIEFLLGDRAELRLRVDFQSRRVVLEEVLQGLLAEANFSPFVLDRIVRPALSERLGGQVLILTGQIRLTSSEIVDSLDGVLESEWGQARRTDVSRVFIEWLTGQRDDLLLVVPLRGLKTLAEERLTGLVVRKVDEHLARQAECTLKQIAAVVRGAAEPFACRPRGVGAAAFQSILTAQVSERVGIALDRHVPETWRFDEVHTLRTERQRRVWHVLEQVRRGMTEGTVIDEAALRKVLPAHPLRLAGGADTGDVLDRILVVTRGEQILQWDVEQHVPPHQMGWLRAAVQSVDTALLPTWALLGLILLFGLSWSAPEASTRLLVSGAGLVLGAILASLVLWLVLALIPQIPGTVRGVPVPWASGLQEVYRFGGVMALSFGGIGLMFMVGGRVMRRKRAVVGD